MNWFKDLPSPEDDENKEENNEENTDFIDDLFNDEKRKKDEEETNYLVLHSNSFIFEKIAALTLEYVDSTSERVKKLVLILNLAVLFIKTMFAAESMGIKRVYDYLLFVMSPLVNDVLVNNDKNHQWIDQYVNDYAKVDMNFEEFEEFFRQLKRTINSMKDKWRLGILKDTDEDLINELEELGIEDPVTFIKNHLKSFNRTG